MQLFTFHSFDDTTPRSNKQREQKFSPAEMEAAQKIARQEGYNEGAEVAARQAKTDATQREQALAQVTQVIAAQCAELLASHRRYLEEQIPSLAQLALTIARKICPQALMHAPLADVEGMIREAAPILVDAPEITITVHSSITDALKNRIHSLLSTDEQKTTIKIIGDEALGMQDCRIAWKNGSITRDAAQLWQQIDQLLEMHIGKSPRPTPAVTIEAPITLNTNA